MNARLVPFDLPQLHRFSVGFDQLFNDLRDNSALINNAGSYPPYNIVKHSDTEFSIEIAVAGFTEKSLDVESKDGRLIVTGNKSVDGLPTAEYLHQGISNRDFTRIFSLAENVEIRSASVENGLLIIHLEKIIPESQKPKKIQICSKQP